MKKLLRYTFLLVFSLNVHSQSGTAVNYMDIARMKSVLYSKITDNGSKVIYTLSNPADPFKDNKDPEILLYVLDVVSGKSALYATLENLRNLLIHPSQSSLLFITKRNDEKRNAIYELPLAGGEAKKLVEFDTDIQNFDISPDGKKIAFVAREPKKKEEKKLPYQPEIFEEELINSSGYVMDLTALKPEKINLAGCFQSIKWSPDGLKLAANITPTSLVDDFYMKQKIAIINSATLSLLTEINPNAKLNSFTWCPDNQKLAVLAGIDINDPTPGCIFIADASTGKSENLFPAFAGKFENVNWFDSKNLYFSASEGVYSTLGKIKFPEKTLTTILEKGSVVFDNFTISKNETISFTGNSATHSSELFILNPNTKQPKRLTFSNPDLEKKVFGKQDVFEYKSKDGLLLQGILIYPVAFDKTKKYPLITVVHGGPEAHNSNGWLTRYSMPGQIAAANGYVVFYPNYRGSTGRGVEFTKSSQGDPAGKEFDDVVDGIDKLIESGFVEKTKVGVTGGSYGGYATAWFSTKYSERFAAGVMFVGISNQISSWGTSDIPNEHYYVHFRKHIWEDYDFMLKRSPIYYIDNAKTPLLIMAGKNDPRVDPRQSVELYRHLKTRTQTPVRLVLYPGEGHGNEKSTARYDFCVRMMNWFDVYLKGDGGKMPERDIE
ncbi:MAG: hypothetical protein A3H98_08935 [Bacteroidetes bacterium RIFCSPLOWO2_02_FULL_36_8]|nr:MAG: hypothetical protein A3H98_08935 [Bacteroidetes bacterium RIFCSPLOWO2_02_FULL_36_8]OFY70491.1 MAG: hypothetical protein A3G23_10235 [Bacteroidetes bacterium RIFCSPLOWO2_12_FULL_37_12]